MMNERRFGEQKNLKSGKRSMLTDHIEEAVKEGRGSEFRVKMKAFGKILREQVGDGKIDDQMRESRITNLVEAAKNKGDRESMRHHNVGAKREDITALLVVGARAMTKGEEVLMGKLSEKIEEKTLAKERKKIEEKGVLDEATRDYIEAEDGHKVYRNEVVAELNLARAVTLAEREKGIEHKVNLYHETLDVVKSYADGKRVAPGLEANDFVDILGEQAKRTLFNAEGEVLKELAPDSELAEKPYMIHQLHPELDEEFEAAA